MSMCVTIFRLHQQRQQKRRFSQHWQRPASIVHELKKIPKIGAGKDDALTLRHNILCVQFINPHIHIRINFEIWLGLQITADCAVLNFSLIGGAMCRPSREKNEQSRLSSELNMHFINDNLH